MCGIIGAVSENESVIEQTIQGTINQDTKGKSSTGMSWVNGGQVKILKRCIEPEEYKKKMSDSFPENKQMSISHNRMPSVGDTTYVNAHPFVDCSGRFALIHNGTARGTDKLRELLISDGHDIKGETDSEVITHVLCHYLNYQDRNIVQALQKTVDTMNGDIGNVLVLDKGTFSIYGVRTTSLYLSKLDDYKVASTTTKAIKHLLDDPSERRAFLEPKKHSIFAIRPNDKLVGKFSKVKRTPKYSSGVSVIGSRNKTNKWKNKKSSGRKSKYKRNKNKSKTVLGSMGDMSERANDESFDGEDKKDMNLPECPYKSFGNDCTIKNYDKCRYKSHWCPFKQTKGKDTRDECRIPKNRILWACEYQNYSDCPFEREGCVLNPDSDDYIDDD